MPVFKRYVCHSKEAMAKVPFDYLMPAPLKIDKGTTIMDMITEKTDLIFAP